MHQTQQQHPDLSTSSESVYKHPSSYRFATQCTTIDSPEGHKDQWGSSSVPIYQTATFKGVNGRYRYARSGNPTRGFLGIILSFLLGFFFTIFAFF